MVPIQKVTGRQRRDTMLGHVSVISKWLKHQEKTPKASQHKEQLLPRNKTDLGPSDGNTEQRQTSK